MKRHSMFQVWNGNWEIREATSRHKTVTIACKSRRGLRSNCPLVTPWSQTSSLQNFEVGFCCSKCPGCGAFLWQNWQTNTSKRDKIPNFVSIPLLPGLLQKHCHLRPVEKWFGLGSFVLVAVLKAPGGMTCEQTSSECIQIPCIFLSRWFYLLMTAHYSVLTPRT